jgi:hypothetical protein
MKTTANLVSVSLLALVAASCSVHNSPALPEGYGEAVTRAFRIGLNIPIKGRDGAPARVRSLNGLDGSERTSQPGYAPLDFSRDVGVKVLRHPIGWTCKMTMDAIFQDALGDTTSSDSYKMNELVNLEVDSVRRYMVPIWQTSFDIGTGTCKPYGGFTVGEATKGQVAEGARIGDVDRWAKAVAFVANRLSGATGPLLSTEIATEQASQNLLPGYIEFLPNAMASAGYSGLKSLTPVWTAWRRAFNNTPPVDPVTRIQALVGPSLPAAGPEDMTTPGKLMKDFLDYIRLDPTLAPEVLSFLSGTSSPQQHLALVQAARKALDDQKLTTVLVADTALRLSFEAWESLAALYDTPARRSAYLAAFLTSVKIIEQDELDLLVASRWSGVEWQTPHPSSDPAVDSKPVPTSDPKAGEDLFQDKDGMPMPALLSLYPFFRMDEARATRVEVTSVPWTTTVTLPESDLDVPLAQEGVVSSAISTDASSDIPLDVSMDVADADPNPPDETVVDGDSVRVMAARTKTGGLIAVIASLPPSIPARAGVRMRYQLDIEGLPDATALTQWQVRRFHVDSSTIKGREIVEKSNVVPVGGTIRIARDITGPAVDYIEMSLEKLVQ